MITIKDVKDKIIEYLYNTDVEKITAAEINGLANVTMILKSVSEIKESTDDVFSTALTSLCSKGFNSLGIDDTKMEE